MTNVKAHQSLYYAREVYDRLQQLRDVHQKLEPNLSINLKQLADEIFSVATRLNFLAQDMQLVDSDQTPPSTKEDKQ
jgi:hypothetical protein